MDDCLEQLLKPEVMSALFGDRKMPKELLREFAKEIESMKKAADAGTFSFQSKLNKLIERKKTEIMVDKAMAANDLRLSKERFAYYTQKGFEADPVEAFQAKLSFARKLGNDARYSATAVAAHTAHVHSNFLFAGVMEKGSAHWEAFTSGAMDLDIRTGVKELALGKELSGTNEMANDIASIVHASNKKMYDEHLRAGVPLRDLPGFTASTTHDGAKLLKATKDTWVEKVHKLNLDRERMFDDSVAGNPELEKKILGSIYDNITKANYAKDDAPFTEGMGRSYTRKLTQSRSLHFLDAGSEHAYNVDFGTGNLSDTVLGGIQKKSKMLALVKLFGANPEKALMTDIDKMIRHYEATGNVMNADNLRRNKESIRNTFLHMSGARDEAALNTAGKIGEMVRNNNVLAMLPWTGVRSVANFSTMAMQIQAMTGKSYLSSLGIAAKEFAASIPKENRAQILEASGYFIQDISSQLQAMGFGDSMRGMQGKAAKLMFKLNGMEAMNKAFRLGIANMLMKETADHLDKPFKSLPAQFQATMLSVGVEEVDFKILSHALETMPDGRRLVTVAGIEGIPPEVVKARAKEKKISPERYINDLRDRYGSMLVLAGDAASTTAGAREQALIRGNSHKGTAEGEVRMYVGQFKSFWAQSWNLFSQFKHAQPDPEALAKGQAVSTGSNKLNLAQYMIGATALGYMGQAFIDMARGRNPKDPQHMETWMDAFVKGGAGNMYGDLLLPDYSWTGAGESVLGPTLGQALGPGVKMLSEGKKDLMEQGSFQKTVKNQATRLIRNNIPLNQAPLMGQALDYLQFDVLEEMRKSGSSAKRNIKQRKDVRDGKRLDFYE